jgi:hypothetical protein
MDVVVNGYRERKIGGSTMGLDVTKEVAALRRMTVPELRARYAGSWTHA